MDAQTETKVMVQDDMEPSVQIGEVFLKASIDSTLLIAYLDHVAFRLWHGDVPIHGANLKKFADVHISCEVTLIVVDVDMLLLEACSLNMIDVSLFSVLLKRWHKNTLSFHIPFGEMTITMDDVLYLFHVSLAGNSFTVSLIN
ncbi:unnamed protein product [Lathyrus oleraceus]